MLISRRAHTVRDRSCWLTLVLLMVGCTERRQLTMVQALPAQSSPNGCVLPPVNELQLTGLGDFPVDPTAVVSVPVSSSGGAGSSAAASSSQAVESAILNLRSGTRVLLVDGLGPLGLAAFGRSAILDLSATSNRVPIAYGPLDGLCTTGGMNYARAGHSATLLPNGDVLIVGGFDLDGHAVSRLELYVPAGDLQTPPATFRVVDAGGDTLLNARAALGHAVAVLDKGDLLITGGVPVGDSGLPDGSAFEGATHHLADATIDGPPRVLDGGPRAFHSATTLPDGRVLLAGGCSEFAAGVCTPGRALGTTVLYQPLSASFSDGPPLLHARFGHDAILRGDGSVLLVGGRGDDPGSALPAELVDPVELRGEDAGLVSGRAARLITGSVLVVGGTQAPSSAVSTWLSATADPVALAPLPEVRVQQTMTPLEDGTVLIAGGWDGAELAQGLIVYDGRGLASTVGTFAKREHTATRLLDGSVLFAGGLDSSSSATADAQIYLRSPIGPYSSLPALTLTGASDPIVARGPDRVSIVDGRLAVTSSAPLFVTSGVAEPESALLGGALYDDFDLDVLAGRIDADAVAALLFAHVSEVDYAFVTLPVGAAVTLYRVSSSAPGLTTVSVVDGCVGAALVDAELPVGDTAHINLEYRDGILLVGTGPRLLLRCTPPTALGRGAVGVGALGGAASFEELSVTR